MASGKFTAALAVAAGLAAAAPAAARDLTVVGWGGASQAAHRAAYFEPFAQARGIRIVEDSYNGGLAKIQAMVETGTVTWDAVMVEDPELLRGCEGGLFEELPWDRLGGREAFIEGAASDCGVGSYVWAMVLAWDGKALKDEPKTWADFWNVERWPGKRGLRKGAKFTLEIALMADGVPPAEVYRVLATEEGIERAFAKLDALKPHIQWWEAGAQPPEWLAAGDVTMTAAYNGRITAANEEGKDFRLSWDGQVYAIDSWAVPKGSENKELAFDFIAFASQPEHQVTYATKIPYGITNKAAIAALPPEVAASLPTGEANLAKGLANDTDFWLDREEELNERFNAWVVR